MKHKVVLCSLIIDPSRDEKEAIGGADGEQQCVVVEGELIVFCGSRAECPAAYLGLESEVTDLGANSAVLPGFVDAHCHPFIVDSPSQSYQVRHLLESGPYKTLCALKRVQEYLSAGWTTVRIAGDAETGYGVLDLQRALAEGLFIGPRIQAAAHYLSIVGGGGDLRTGPEQAGCLHPDGRIVTGPEEMRLAVREEIKYGSKWIKLLVSGAFMTAHDNPDDMHFSDEELRMATSEASRLSTPVMAHAHSVASIAASLQAGVRSIEHGTFIAKDPRLAQQMARQGVFLIPTLFIGDYYTRVRPSEIASTLTSSSSSSSSATATVDPLAKMVELSRQTRALHLQGVALAYRAGVQICTGSDDVGAWAPALSMRELVILSEAGVTPIDCLRAATVNGARLLSLEGKIGTLQPGACADLIAVRGNPLEDLTLLETHLFFVMRGGVVVRRQA